MATKTKEPKFTTVSGAITIHKVLPYKGCMIYIRSISGAFGKNAVLFEYLVTYKNELYSSYILTEMPEGQTALTEEEIKQSAALILTGATATIDTITDADRITEKVKTKKRKPASVN